MRRFFTSAALITCLTLSSGVAQERHTGTLRYHVRTQTASVPQRERTVRIVDLDGAQPGTYYRWKPATGANRKGYVAPDGTVWRLMEADGIVRVDQNGRIIERTAQNRNHSQTFIWRIERDATSQRTVWVSRDPKTGILSYLYRRPATNAHRHFRARATIASNFEVVGLDWVDRPTWSSDRSIARQLRQGLPDGIFRKRRDKYVPASAQDLAQL